jgi:hypothetical protein
MPPVFAEKFASQIKLDIERDGRTIVGVFDGDPPFGYTIGNELKGLPELLVIGLSRDLSFLNMLSDMMIKRGTRFAEGETVNLGGNYPVKIITTNTMAHAEYTVQAGNFYGSDDYTVQQVLVPDRDGIFPDDARCAERFRVPVLRRH